MRLALFRLDIDHLRILIFRFVTRLIGRKLLTRERRDQNGSAVAQLGPAWYVQCRALAALRI
jgi:hypothetical protein